MDWKEINRRYVSPALHAREEGKNEEAESIFKEGLAATNNDGYIALKYGEFLKSESRLKEAKQYLEIAVARLPLEKYKRTARGELREVEQEIDKNAEKNLPVPMNQRPGRRIVLLSCTKRKKDYACTARGLYSASEEFESWAQLAERSFNSSYVVSAKHGLVEFTQLLCPYDRKLDDYSEKKEAWAGFIAARLRMDGATANDEITIVANDLYAACLSRALHHYGIKTRTFDLKDRPTPDLLE